MTLSFSFNEAKKNIPNVTSFTYTFVNEFTNAWTFLKENQSHHATVIFPTAAERDKWFNTAKAYGAQHPDKVVVSKVKGTGSDDKNSGKLVFRMEDHNSRQRRLNEAAKRLEMAETLKAHGIEVRRGKGANLDQSYADFMKLNESEQKALREKHARKTTTTPAVTLTDNERKELADKAKKK